MSTNSTTPALSSVNTNYLNATLPLTLEQYKPLLSGTIHVLDLISKARTEMGILMEMAKPFAKNDSRIKEYFLDHINDQESEMGSVIVSIGEAAGYLVTESLLEVNY